VFESFAFRLRSGETLGLADQLFIDGHRQSQHLTHLILVHYLHTNNNTKSRDAEVPLGAGGDGALFRNGGSRGIDSCLAQQGTLSMSE